MSKERFDIAEICKNVRHLDAKELMQLLQTQKTKLWSWGCDGFTNLENKALKFRVRANRHKGYVYIVVNASDLFDVYLVSTHGNLIKKLPNIYFSELVDTIDNDIEFVDSYKF